MGIKISSDNYLNGLAFVSISERASAVLHLSALNDETLCGKLAISGKWRYVEVTEGRNSDRKPCALCHKRAEKRYAEETDERRTIISDAEALDYVKAGKLFDSLSANCPDLVTLWEATRQPFHKHSDKDKIAGTHALYCEVCKAARETLCAPVSVSPIPSVPDMDAVPSECFYGCSKPVTGAFCDYVGNTMGVCDDHTSQVGTSEVFPVVTEIPAEDSVTVPTVGVIQSRPGNAGFTHYHTPGCRDIQREMKRWGQKEEDVIRLSFTDVAGIISFEYADVENGDWESMVLHANESYDGIRIMPCLTIPNGMAGIQEISIKSGMFTLANVLESERCVLCETHGDVSMPGNSVGGNWVCGYCLDNSRTLENLNSHSLTYYVKTEGAGIMQECRSCGSIGPKGTFAEFHCEIEEDTVYAINGPWIDPLCGCERHANPTEVPCPDHAATDAGFVETIVRMEYLLSVLVDETTGATVELGWVTLGMNAAQAEDHDRIAEAYGKAHGSGTPRHGWSSIITVHNMAEI